MKKKRFLILALALSIPVFLSLIVRQAFRYTELKEQVAALEAEQVDWLEKNKKAIAGLALWSSPERIEKLARETLGLKRLDRERTLTIMLPSRKGF